MSHGTESKTAVGWISWQNFWICGSVYLADWVYRSCNNVAGLFEAIGITCNTSEWRLFIDSSSRSLKAVLLHNGNNYPCLPMAHSVHLKEDYTSVKMLLSALKYDDYGWEVIGDFKILSFLMGHVICHVDNSLCLDVSEWVSSCLTAHQHKVGYFMPL